MLYPLPGIPFPRTWLMPLVHCFSSIIFSERGPLTTQHPHHTHTYTPPLPPPFSEACITCCYVMHGTPRQLCRHSIVMGEAEGIVRSKKSHPTQPLGSGNKSL